MNNFEDEQNQKEKKLNKILQNFENLFSEFETLNNAIKPKKTKKKKEEKIKEQIIKENNNIKNQQIQNNQLNNFLNNQTYHKENLILLSNKQEFNVDKSYQKLLNLLIEENDSIPDVRFIKNNSDDYLLLQLFTSFSLMSRKIYLNNNNIKNNKINKYKSFINEINNYKFNKNSPLNNDDLNFINSNLISIDEIYPENKEKIQFEINLNKELNKEINNFNNENNNINNNNENININLNSLKNYKLCKGEKFFVDSKLKNIQEKNLKFMKSKKYNLLKIFDLNDSIFKGMNKNEIDDLMNKIYNEKNIYDEYDFNFSSEEYYENLLKNENKNDNNFNINK